MKMTNIWVVAFFSLCSAVNASASVVTFAADESLQVAMDLNSSRSLDEGASDCTSPNCDSTGVDGAMDYYTELEKQFANGTQPEKQDLVGWYAGRCYNATSRSTPEAGLLVGFIESFGGDNGPAFPGVDVLKFMALRALLEGADVYDNMNSKLESSVTSFVSSQKIKYSVACVKDGSLSVSHQSGTEWQVRKYRNYLILKAIGKKDSNPFGYCYYFKKVK